MMPDQPTLQTKRLLLRAWRPEDAPALQQLAGAREVAEGTLNLPHPYPDGLAERYIADTVSWWQDDQNCAWAITLSDGRLIGGIGLFVTPRHARGEIGYWLGTEYWGQGFATEACTAVLEYGFDRRGLNRIYASHFTFNPASGRVMQKLGMRYEGTMREHVRRDDTPLDLVYYGILRSDWGVASKEK